MRKGKGDKREGHDATLRRVAFFKSLGVSPSRRNHRRCSAPHRVARCSVYIRTCEAACARAHVCIPSASVLPFSVCACSAVCVCVWCIGRRVRYGSYEVSLLVLVLSGQRA